MTYIDDFLRQALATSGGKPVAVLIGCGDSCDAVAKALHGAGVRVTSQESALLGSIAAEITAAQLDAVQATPGVTSIELDREASILGGH